MPTTRTLTRDILHGSLGFGLVSVAAFSVWGFASQFFRDFGGEPAMYAAIAVVFLVLSGLILSPLAGGMGRFYQAFLPAFALYAVVWSAVWFAMRDRTGEWVASAAGCVVFSLISMKILGSLRGWVVATLALFVLHSAGYFAGDWVMHGHFLAPETFKDLPKTDKAQAALMGKLAWGLLYGLGFGAGIGWVFNRARVAA